MDVIYEDRVRILKMRAHCGPAEWRGKYNYQDTENLTKEIKDIVGYKRHSWNDGIFYISYNDFVQYFEILNICHYRNTHSLSSLEDVICSHHQMTYYQFSIKKTKGI